MGESHHRCKYEPIVSITTMATLEPGVGLSSIKTPGSSAMEVNVRLLPSPWRRSELKYTVGTTVASQRTGRTLAVLPPWQRYKVPVRSSPER